MNGLDPIYIGLRSRRAINMAVKSSGTNLQKEWPLWDIGTGGYPPIPEQTPEGVTTLVSSPNAIAFDNKMFETVVTAGEWLEIAVPHPMVTEKQVTKIRALKGKYSFVRTSSEEFALRKQNEIDQEG